MISLDAPSSSSMFRRKRSTTSTSVSTDDNAYGFGNTAPSSSPLLSSSPLRTPLHLTRSHVCAEWLAEDYADDSDVAIYGQQDKTGDLSLSGSSHSAPLTSLPSLMSKFAERAPWDDAPLSYNPFSRQTPYFCPQGDSATADDSEEYDLESMDIHIHETYFATSAERGRWMSSPIVPRTRFQASPPLRGHSSPVKKPTEDSSRAESRIIDPRIHTLSGGHDEDTRCLSPLPPSSPISSPLSSLSFFGDDCNDSDIPDPCPNLGNFCSSSKPPASTHFTSPVERSQTPYEAPIFESALLPSDCLSTPLSPVISRLSSPCPVRSPSPTGVPGFEPDSTLSPLSQFDLDLPEGESLNLPLSGMENRLHTEQCTDLGVTVDTVQGHSGFPSVQLLAINTNHEPLDVSLDTIYEANPRKVTKKTVERRTQKNPVIRCGSPFSKKRGTENHATNHPEPATKRPKPSRPKDDSESRSIKSRSRRSGEPTVGRRRKSPSRPALQHSDSKPVCVRDTKILESAGQPEQATLVSSDAVNAEFHASLTGILIEAFAASRATSMDATALYLVLSQAHPHLTIERPKQELLEDIVGVLEAGRVRCGMFEKVDSSGEGSRHKALEGRWFYIPERDEDAERASLISAIMPRQKRSETKKYKQYYYRPLGKMSRWNSDDEP